MLAVASVAKQKKLKSRAFSPLKSLFSTQPTPNGLRGVVEAKIQTQDTSPYPLHSLKIQALPKFFVILSDSEISKIAQQKTKFKASL